MLDTGYIGNVAPAEFDKNRIQVGDRVSGYSGCRVPASSCLRFRSLDLDLLGHDLM